MGPIVLFDKSFLQSLSLDESVWFDHFFLAVVCPFFFVETLADLAKAPGTARTPEQHVQIIADKTPVMSGAPCVHHSQLCIANLLGGYTPHLGQIPVPGGRPVRGPDGRPAAVINRSPEAEAFERWQRAQFQEVERDMAAAWRRMLSELDLSEVAFRMHNLGVTPKSCKSVEDAYGLAASIVHSRNAPQEQLSLLAGFVQMPVHVAAQALQRWSQAAFPPLANFAPYAAYVLKVELFFQIALAANLVSAERASNRVDIAYLFYLPFCHAFVSGDNLHRRCAPPFLRNGQEFLWATDLKRDLARINKVLSAAPEEAKRQGLHQFAPRPPGDSNDLVVALWGRYAPGWSKGRSSDLALSPSAERKLVDHLNAIANAPTSLEVAELSSDELTGISIQRVVPMKKGSWWLLPESIKGEGRDVAV